MSDGKDRYEERRRLENENATLREQQENRRLKHEAVIEECGIAVMNGLRDLFEGRACLMVEHVQDGQSVVRFKRG